MISNPQCVSNRPTPVFFFVHNFYLSRLLSLSSSLIDLSYLHIWAWSPTLPHADRLSVGVPSFLASSRGSYQCFCGTVPSIISRYLYCTAEISSVRYFEIPYRNFFLGKIPWKTVPNPPLQIFYRTESPRLVPRGSEAREVVQYRVFRQHDTDDKI